MILFGKDGKVAMIDLVDRRYLVDAVNKVVNSIPITDIHTHLYSECFGSLLLYGIDELLTYHYLVSEAMRHIEMGYDSFYSMGKAQQAECIWDTLFVRKTPLSESARSVITIFNRLGLDVNIKNLNYYRDYFESRTLSAHIDHVLEVAGIKCVVMTNDPLDKAEHAVWENGYKKDNRFKAALRVDRLLNNWEEAVLLLRGIGYKVDSDLSEGTIDEIKRFLLEWIEKMDALYCGVSVTPNFTFFDGTIGARIIEECILPVCRLKNIPFTLMIGVKRQVNPDLRLAGDSVGKAEIKELERLCLKYTKNKFLVTILSLENQHELVITARKFRNLMVFGCWWFLNSPALIDFITRIRLEWLGTSFIAQHSDCRVLEQLISKWVHSRTVISEVLVNKYSELYDMGYQVTEEQIQKDASNIFGENFWSFLNKTL
jgi:hypothetical protein